jgi:hypothetical protein
MARRKAPEYKKEDLIKMIVEWTGDGIVRGQQIQFIKALGYGIDYCYQLFKDAKPLIDEMLKDIGKGRLESTIADLEQQRFQALEDGDKKFAHEIMKEINKISGLHKENLDITSDGKAIENIQVIKITEYIKPNKTEEHE